MIQYNVAKGLTTTDGDKVIGDIEIRDRSNPLINNGHEGSYCIGFRYIGGDQNSQDNWIFDHTNFWYRDTYAPISIQLSKEETEQALKDRLLTINDLLIKFIELH